LVLRAGKREREGRERRERGGVEEGFLVRGAFKA